VGGVKGEESGGTGGAQASRRAFRIDAIASGFVGALALAVSTYNVYLQREQIRAQVWPHLELTNSYSVDEFSWNVENTGVGPAKVEGVRVSVDGKPAKTWHEVLDLGCASDPELRRMLESPDGHIGKSWTSLTRRVIGAGVERHAYRLSGTKPELTEALRRLAARSKIEVCYCSTLGECWMLHEEQPIKRCPTDGFTFTD
jgi:hypothetical protein